MGTGLNPAVQYDRHHLCHHRRGSPQHLHSSIRRTNARRGILCAVVLWFGFIATSWAKAYIFEVRTLQIYVIYTGYYYLIEPCSSGQSSAHGRKNHHRPLS